MTSPSENRTPEPVAPVAPQPAAPPPPGGPQPPLAPRPPVASPPPATALPPGPTGAGAEVTEREKVKIAPTRTSMVWLGVWAGVVVLILLIVFIAQNTAAVQIAFFGLEGQIPLALALLIAGVAGAIVAMSIAAARIIQLRRLFRRSR